MLHLQKEVVKTKTRISFILLSAPWSVLCYYAEELSLKVPLQVRQKEESGLQAEPPTEPRRRQSLMVLCSSQVLQSPFTNASEHLLSYLSLPNPLQQDVPNPPTLFYTCDFRNNKQER